MVSLSVVPFGRGGLPVSRRPGGVISAYYGGAAIRVIERRCTEVHSQTGCFSISVQSLIPCLRRENSPLDGAARDLVEIDAEDDDVRPELSRFGGAPCSAGEALSHEGQSGFHRIAGDFSVGAVGDDAAPASLPVGVV